MKERRAQNETSNKTAHQCARRGESRATQQSYSHRAFLNSLLHSELFTMETSQKKTIKACCSSAAAASCSFRRTTGKVCVAPVGLGARRQMAAALVLASSLCLIIVAAQASASNSGQQQVNQQGDQKNARAQQEERALEAELNTIVRQHDISQGLNSKLAAAIISRLMMDNLTGSNLTPAPIGEDFESDLGSLEQQEALQAALQGVESAELAPEQQQAANGPNGYESLKLKKLLSLLQNYELGDTGMAYGQYPLLPSSQAATMKRATNKLAFMQQRPVGGSHMSNAYGRNSFDFGLGKRVPGDSSSLVGSSSGNILRFGESSIGLSGGANVQPVVGQFGKRPSAHRYDFGLGKRVASVSSIKTILSSHSRASH